MKKFLSELKFTENKKDNLKVNNNNEKLKRNNNIDNKKTKTSFDSSTIEEKTKSEFEFKSKLYSQNKVNILKQKENVFNSLLEVDFDHLTNANDTKKLFNPFPDKLNSSTYDLKDDNKQEIMSTKDNSVISSNKIDTNLEAWFAHQKYNYNVARFNRDDEVKFAEAEATNLLEKLNRIKINKLKIWQKVNKPDLNNQERAAAILPKIRKDINYFIHSTGTSSKYLTDDQKVIINDAMKIIEKNKILESNPITSEDKKIPIVTYLQTNKEIWLKNMLLRIIKEESNELVKKERKIEQGLVNAEIKLTKDISKFTNFCDQELKAQIKEEMIMSEIVNKNKSLSDLHKKLLHDKKLLIDETEKIVKTLFVSKSYAIFICYSLGDRQNLKTYFNLDGFNFDYFEFNSINKEKDIQKLCQSLE